MKFVVPLLLIVLVALSGCGDPKGAQTPANGAPSNGSHMGNMTSSIPAVPQDVAPPTNPLASAVVGDGQGGVAAPADQAPQAASSAVDAAGDMAESVVAGAGEMAGQAADAGPAVAAVAPAPAADAAMPVTADVDVAIGATVYENQCKACHATGAAGAPTLEDAANWAPRLEQGIEILTRHAIEGFKGGDGYMPPKGGFMNLSDAQVMSAVAYMMEQTR